MNNPLKWRLYYRDGQTVSCADSTWEAAPRTDIVAVVWKYDNGPAQTDLGTPYYLNAGDWIARCWDPTLYLRGMNVKFGRWARNALFQQAWQQCVAYVSGKEIAPDDPSLQGSTVCMTRAAVQGDEPFSWRLWYDNGKILTGSDMDAWEVAHTDGVLAASYRIMMNGVVVSFGKRRFTYFYWRGAELINTDDLHEVVRDYPAFKFGEPHFTGKSYQIQAEAIAAALADKLEDL